MSNINRPRTGLPKCPHCGDTTRDSNGQCHCRNILYRTLRAIGTDETARTAARSIYNEALVNGKSISFARNLISPPKGLVIEARPDHDIVKTDSGYSCPCGFTGTGTIQSIRAHVARERRQAAQA